MSERQGLPPKLLAGIDVGQDGTFKVCINDEHIDVLFTASTSIKNDGSVRMSELAYQTVEYRLAKILVDVYNGDRRHLRTDSDDPISFKYGH